MKSLRRIVVTLTAALIVVPLAVPPTASAAVAVALSKQISLSDGDQITVTLSGVPATQGVYIQQCYQPQVGQRAATGLKCNGSLQQTDVMIWASMDGSRGSQSASAPLAFTVRDKVTVGTTVYECGAWNCSLFVYRDHRGIADTTLDTVVPLVFLAQQEVKMRSFGLAKDGAAVRVGATMNLQTDSMVTEQGVDVRAKSVSPKVCSVARGKVTTTVRFTASGTCTLRLAAKGDAVFKPFVSEVSYKVG